MWPRERLNERHRALSSAWQGLSRTAAELEQYLSSLVRREDRLPVLRDLRFTEAEMVRLGGELSLLEQQMGDEPAQARSSFQSSSSASPESSPEPLAVSLDLPDAEAQPARIDLEIRVKFEKRQDGTALLYTLNSPIERLSLYETVIREPVVVGRPERFRADLIRRLEALHERRGVDQEQLLAEEIEKELARLGQDLYRRLFNEGMRSAYLRYREEVRSVRITSDEPWIPWELVQPYEPRGLDGRPVKDDFLCARFQLTRWLAKSSPPPKRVEIHRLACIEAGRVPGMRPLAHAQDELQKLRHLAASHPGVVDASLPGASFAEVDALLEAAGLQLIHVVGHGDFNSQRPDEAGVALVDSRSLRASHLVGPLATALARDRPFVFFNACRVGQQGWALTGLGGWAEAWVCSAGAAGFLAPQWSVPDSLAWRFAETFYDALAQRHTFGSAVTQARLRVKTLNRTSPAWLAYALYAHPGGTVEWPAVAEA